jgi:hypothetical protein
MRGREPNTAARRSVFVPLCAAIGLGLCLLFAEAGCLNPVPDEFPSNQERGGVVVAPPAQVPESPGGPSSAPTPADPATMGGDFLGVGESAADAGAPASTPDAGADAGARETDAVQ